jgi:hypothetical protein
MPFCHKSFTAVEAKEKTLKYPALKGGITPAFSKKGMVRYVLEKRINGRIRGFTLRPFRQCNALYIVLIAYMHNFAGSI